MAHDCHFSLIQRCYDIINGGNSYVTKNCPMSFTTSASLIEFLFQLSKAQTQFQCGRSTGFSFTKFTERKTPSKQEKKNRTWFCADFSVKQYNTHSQHCLWDIYLLQLTPDLPSCGFTARQERAYDILQDSYAQICTYEIQSILPLFYFN